MSIYKFLCLSCSVEAEGISLNPNELLEKFNFNSKNSFNLITKQNGETTSEIFYSDGSSIFVYDCIDNVLYTKSSKSVVLLLSERMAV